MDILKARSELSLGKTIYDMNLRVVDYGRVSTDKDDQLNSLENQISYFSDMISSVSSWEHVGSFADEGISGTQVHKRCEFLRMIEEARLGHIDLILTKEVSRFARNTIDSIKYTEILLSYGVIVYFISDNINTIYPDSEFRLTLMASMAQDEVRKLSERVKFGIKRSIKNRKVGGGGIYGYLKKDGKLTIIKDEAKCVEMLFNLYASGNYGLKKISEHLLKHGYKTRKGLAFSDTTLKKMLKNPRYKGYYTANLTQVEDYKTHKKKALPKTEWIIEKDTLGNVPPIVSENLWNKANKVYEERYKKRNKNVLNKCDVITNKKYTSKIICGEHNKNFIRCASGKRANDAVWQCNEYLRHGLKGCRTPIIKESALDKIFSKVISKLINKDTLLKNIIYDYSSILKDNKNLNNFNDVEERIIEQKSYENRLFEMYLKKMISDEEFIDRKNMILKKIDELEKTLTTFENNKISSKVDNYIKNISSEVNSLLDVEKNLELYIELFIDKVIVNKINDSRKHINLNIMFNFNEKNQEIEIF